MKKDFHNVDHPDFEVHNFFSLAERVGYHATNLQQMTAKGKINFLATNFFNKKNMFAISKAEIQRLKEMRQNAPTKQARSYHRAEGTKPHGFTFTSGGSR